MMFVPTVSAFTCKKPITELTMIWDGAGARPIDVEAFKGNENSQLLGRVTSVNIGDQVTIQGYDGSPKDVTWVILDSGSGTILGTSVFHMSCSDDDMNGPEDCGKPQGDGKRNDPGSINDWVFEGMVAKGARLDCTPPR